MKQSLSVLSSILCGMVLFAGVLAAEPENVGPAKLSVQARAEYTDNRDSSPDKESTFDFYLGPRLDAFSRTERTLLDFYYAPSYRHRTDPNENEDKNQWHHDLGAVLDHGVSPRLKLRLEENFNVTDDPTLQKDELNIRRDASFTANRVLVGAKYLLNEERSNVGLSVRHRLKNFDSDDGIQYVDEQLLDAGLTFWHMLERSLGLRLQAGMFAAMYDDVEPANRDFTSAYGGVGLEKIFSPQVRVGVDVGGTVLEYDSSSLDSETSPFVNAFVTVTPDPRVRVKLTGAHSLLNSEIYPFASRKNTDMVADVEYDATAQVSVGFTGTYRIEEYDVDSVPPETLADIRSGRLVLNQWAREFFLTGQSSGDENTLIAQARLVYRLDDKTRLTLVQRYEDVDSDVSTTFKRNSSSVSLLREF